MADYKESAVSGTSWHRCCHIEINNPYGSMPSVRFDEEKRIAIDDGSISVPVGGISTMFNNPGKEFAMRNPVTGEPVGVTMTYGEVYAVLWSLYMSIAEERDAALQT